MSRISRLQPIVRRLTAGGFGVGVLLLVADKGWDYWTFRTENARQERIRTNEDARAAKREAEEDAVRREQERRDRRLRGENLEAIRQRDETVIRLLSDLAKKVENERPYIHSDETVPSVLESRSETRDAISQDEELLSGRGSYSKTMSLGRGGSISVKGIFAGERVDLCGFRGFSVTPIEAGSRFEISTLDRTIPGREFTGWRRTIVTDTPFSISPACEVTLSSERAGGNTVIYFRIREESE